MSSVRSKFVQSSLIGCVDTKVVRCQVPDLTKEGISTDDGGSISHSFSQM